MLKDLCFAAGLVVVTVGLHSAGFALLIRGMLRWHALARAGFLAVTCMVIALTISLLLIHLGEIVLWGLFYYWQGCLQDLSSSVYFSGGAYTTAGFSGLILPQRWQTFVMLETMTGILMCGLSTGFFFGVVMQWIDHFRQRRDARDPRSSPPMST